MGKKEREDEPTKDFNRAEKAVGKPSKKGEEEIGQNHQAPAQERKNLVGREAVEPNYKIHQMGVDFSRRRTSS